MHKAGVNLPYIGIAVNTETSLILMFHDIELYKLGCFFGVKAA